uniref:Uncharacterized protein n=1 Tax=Cucumis melo TaxID=3656 RepID=A0A9I9EGH9_CUCME
MPGVSHHSSPSNELASRPIPPENVSGSMPGVWVEVLGARDPKIERLMTNTEQREETQDEKTESGAFPLAFSWDEHRKSSSSARFLRCKTYTSGKRVREHARSVG